MVRFHIAESSNNISLMTAAAVMFRDKKELLRDDIEIASFFGSPPVIWNGGRMMLGNYKSAVYKEIIKHYNSFGIPYRFTWTNPVLTEDDLDDYDCNDLLDFADNGLNEAIVNSPILEEYIRKEHPNMKLTSSTCKCIRNMDDVKAELARPYSLVVLDFNFNNNFEELEKLTPEERKRCELLCNASCLPGCKRRAEHYKFIGEQQLHYREYLEKIHRMTPEEASKHKLDDWVCPDREIFLFGEKEYPLHIKPDDVYGIYSEMGFENFKLEGRGTGLIILSEQIARYIAKPEYLDKVRFTLNHFAVTNFHMNIGNTR